MKVTAVLTVKLTYFKAGGKYYSDEAFPLRVRLCGEGPHLNGLTAYLPEVIDCVRSMRDSCRLPGLGGGWDGPILITCDPDISPPHLLPNGDL